MFRCLARQSGWAPEAHAELRKVVCDELEARPARHSASSCPDGTSTGRLRRCRALPAKMQLTRPPWGSSAAAAANAAQPTGARLGLLPTRRRHELQLLAAEPQIDACPTPTESPPQRLAALRPPATAPRPRAPATRAPGATRPRTSRSGPRRHAPRTLQLGLRRLTTTRRSGASIPAVGAAPPFQPPAPAADASAPEPRVRRVPASRAPGPPDEAVAPRARVRVACLPSPAAVRNAGSRASTGATAVPRARRA